MIIEQIGSDFGVTVRYTVHGNACSVEFFAAEVIGRDVDGQNPIYERQDSGSLLENPAVFADDDVQRYVDGWVKWDGCSHYSFGDEDGQLHLCGIDSITRLSTVIAAIYERCGELMKEAGTNLLKGEFKVGGTQ